MGMYIYTIEKWDKKRKEWIPFRFGSSDLQEMADSMQLIEDALPDTEFRLAQYTVEEFQYIRSFG